VFNLERSDGDEYADFLFLGPCEKTLPKALGSDYLHLFVASTSHTFLPFSLEDESNLSDYNIQKESAIPFTRRTSKISITTAQR
jgi:hypothetical protein